jgi:hypothetical protein
VISSDEIKWLEKRNFKIPVAFVKAYPDLKVELLHKMNMMGVLRG